MMRATTSAAIMFGAALSGAGLWWAAEAGWLRNIGLNPSHERVSAAERHVLYYRNPMGEPDTSPVPKKDSMGMDYIPVYADDMAEAPASVAGAKDASTGKRILYYRNPMGLADRSPVPKKDSMGMDYIPVFAEEGTDEPGTIRIALDRVQRLGVRTAKVIRQTLSESVVLSGTVTADERTQGVVTLKFPANVVKLHVAATGERVRKGQALFDIQSPFILKEELDLALALRAQDVSDAAGSVYARANARSIQSTRERLRLYEVPDVEIDRLIHTGVASGSITWRAPQDGVVLEKPVVVGMQAAPGEILYRLADLSKIWVIGEAPESAIGIAKAGAMAHITLTAFPGLSVQGKVTFVYPEVSMTTRTVKVRIELPNPSGLLLPGMFASAEIQNASVDRVLTVPDSAILDSGSRQVVLVARGEGRFLPRAVRTGRRGNGVIEIMSGLDGTEDVVTSATFLIDAESNLRAAFETFTGDDANAKGSVR